MSTIEDLKCGVTRLEEKVETIESQIKEIRDSQKEISKMLLDPEDGLYAKLQKNNSSNDLQKKVFSGILRVIGSCFLLLIGAIINSAF